MSNLVLDSASRWFGNVVAVNDVSLNIGPGVTGLLGPNGAGKTTLMAMMAGFLAPSSGHVTLDGEPVWRNTAIYRQIGLVPERADEARVAVHAGRTWSGEFRTVRKDGTPMLVWVSNSPVRGDDGAVVGVIGVSLDITAVPGPGNLLGNLLCAVAGLLDGGGLLTQVSQILNSILAILRP